MISHLCSPFPPVSQSSLALSPFYAILTSKSLSYIIVITLTLVCILIINICVVLWCLWSTIISLYREHSVFCYKQKRMIPVVRLDGRVIVLQSFVSNKSGLVTSYITFWHRFRFAFFALNGGLPGTHQGRKPMHIMFLRVTFANILCSLSYLIAQP